MKIIGVTGKSGSGKSTFVKIFNNENNYKVINIDTLVHKLLNEDKIKSLLVNMFGKEILKDNAIDRKALGRLVFASKESIQKYNDFIYEYMQIELDHILKKSKKDIILDWPLLPITKYFDVCTYTILITAPDNKRQTRIVLRDNISPEYHKARDIDDKIFANKKFSFELNNNGDLQTFYNNIQKIKQQIEG